MMATLNQVARQEILAAWPIGRVYAPNAVPSNPTTPYIVLYGDAGRDSVLMNDGRAGSDSNRLTPMAVGKTEREIEAATSAIRAGLRGKCLEFEGCETSPIALESSGGAVRDPDGGALLSQTLFLAFNTFTKEIP